MDTIFSRPNTDCRTCIFCSNKDCRLNKLTLYKENNITVLDGPVIQSFICPYYRTEEWLKEHKNESNTMAVIKKENQIPYIAILLHLSPSILIESLNKIKKFKTPPKCIYIITEDNSPEFIQSINNALVDLNIKWTVHFSLEKHSWHTIFNNYQRNEFLLLINGYPGVPNTWTQKLTDNIQDKLMKFSYAENKKQTMMLVSPVIYNEYYFQYGHKLFEKLREERHRQKCIL